MCICVFTNYQIMFPSILVKISKETLVLMDKNDDKMEQLNWDSDNGVNNQIGMVTIKWVISLVSTSNILLMLSIIITITKDACINIC